ncbi:hypothetical protein K9N50_11570 [bacterium]|nr:hypothetical protein [bacterium]
MKLKKTIYLLFAVIIVVIVSISLIGCNTKKQPEIKDLTDWDHLYLEGLVTFNQQVDTVFVKQVLNELFLKYIKVDFSVENKNGKFTEIVDQTLNPHLVLMVHGSDIETNVHYFELKQFCRDWSYFYSIEIDQIKLTDEAGNPYKKESKFDYIKPIYGLYEDAEKLAQQKYVEQIMFDKVRFTETGRIHLHKFFDF